MRFFTFVIAVTALIIAGCAAFFSVSGLATLFAGAFASVVIMGGVLEVGKLVATSFLYRNWTQCNWFLKIYFLIAIFVLMIITSMGIFGYLSKAHLEQEGEITNAVVIVDRLDYQIARKHQSIIELSTKKSDVGQDASIDYSEFINQQVNIRDSAWSMVQDDIRFEQTQIDNTQKFLDSSVALISEKYELNLQDLNTQQDRLQKELELISSEERRLFSKDQTAQKQQLRQQATDIISKKENLRNSFSEEKQRIINTASTQIQVHQENINGFRQQAQTVIDNANEKINRFKTEQEESVSLDDINVQNIEQQISEIYTEISELQDTKFAAESKVREVEAEVGPIKYVAQSIFGGSDKSSLDKAITFLMVMIVLVFDPFAVALVIAYNFLIVSERATQPTKTSTNNKLSWIKKIQTRDGKIRNANGEVIAEANKI